MNECLPRFYLVSRNLNSGPPNSGLRLNGIGSTLPTESSSYSGIFFLVISHQDFVHSDIPTALLLCPLALIIMPLVLNCKVAQESQKTSAEINLCPGCNYILIFYPSPFHIEDAQY